MNTPPAPQTLYNDIGTRARPARNWILDPLQDAVFIIGAPLIVLALALAAFALKGAADATTLIILVHVVLTVAHHMPTFIRIYGDLDLFRRFRWSFVLGPVIPFAFAMAVLGYLIHREYPLEYFFYIFIILALWDPWHFLMQHYGFMRIYDRGNAAPRRLAARMDMLLCATWFVFILLASSDWVPEILADLYTQVRLPLVMGVPAGALALLTEFARYLALLASAAYIVYLAWCRQNGYLISGAKLALFAVTFSVMYFTYTPNAWILGIEPGWTFKAGFAALGIVHMTQYLAIVWRYNRSLASRPGRFRAGVLQRLHARGGWLIGGSYVLFCLAYGELLTTVHQNRWLMAVLLATGFTSTLMHYYFDGFIWKMRHRQNRENLAMTDGPGAQTSDSWWNALRPTPARAILLRQCLYFGVPMALLTAGAATVWTAPPAHAYVEHMYQAQLYSQQGLATAAQREAGLAFDAMNAQLPYAARITELKPTAAREAELAFLIYNQSHYAHVVLPALSGEPSDSAPHRAAVDRAIRVLERALERGGPLGHPGRETMSREDGLRTLDTWRGVVSRMAGGNGAPAA